MKINIYEVEDEDVLDTFFGEDSRFKPTVEIARDHGELIFSDFRPNTPDPGDTLTMKDERDENHEYTVLARTYILDDDLAVLLVHELHQVPDAQGQS